jgi:hypothetical protein
VYTVLIKHRFTGAGYSFCFTTYLRGRDSRC